MFKKFYATVKKQYPFLPSSPLSKLAKFLGIQNHLKDKRVESILRNVEPEIKNHVENYSTDFKIFLDTKLNNDAIHNLSYLLQTKNVKGDILELGTYQGKSTIILAKFLKQLNSKKIIYTCDTFEGIPYEDKYSMMKNAKGMYANTSIETVKQNFRRFGVLDQIICLPGEFENTLEKELSDKKFSFIFVDCDIYDSSVTGINFGYSRLNEGGIMAFDNYDYDEKKSDWGITKAVNDFCKNENVELINAFKYESLPYIVKSRSYQ